MQVVQDDIWLCEDCLFAAVNGDFPEDEETCAAVEAGLQRLGPDLVPDFDVDTEEGYKEFSWSYCQCCGSHLGGQRHRFAVLGPD